MEHVEPPLPPLVGRGHIALTLGELQAWGERFGRAAQAPLVVTLAGDLGAGKTTLAQAICRGYGVAEPVTSPTYAIVHEYRGASSSVYHLDLYRLERPDELTNVGWDDIVQARALVLVEWPERAGDRLPGNRVVIDLEHAPGDESRRLLLTG